MKPVNKGADLGEFPDYSLAKDELLRRLGLHCSYCEVAGVAQSLDVEHIYPKDPHPAREKKWENFLVACKSCNTYKNLHLGNRRQRNLFRKYLWPHLDNTFRSFIYFPDGRVETNQPVLLGDLAFIGTKTIEMAGLMKTQIDAARFEPDIPYTAMSKRRETWNIAQDERHDYLAAPNVSRPARIANSASRIGHFSIWMHVFHDRPEVRRELIRAFCADPACFDAATNPIQKGRV